MTESPTGVHRLFPAYSVYLWTMAGFLFFYALEIMVARRRSGLLHDASEDDGSAPWQAWVHIGGFALYAWLISHLMVWTGKGTLALCLYAVAMGLHIFPIACSLSTHYRAVYDRRGAFLLALAVLAGWATGLALNIPKSIMVNLVAIVAGGVILNTSIAELPKEKDGRSWAFLAGATAYTALLLIMSRFEKGGEV